MKKNKEHLYNIELGWQCALKVTFQEGLYEEFFDLHNFKVSTSLKTYTCRGEGKYTRVRNIRFDVICTMLMSYFETTIR